MIQKAEQFEFRGVSCIFRIKDKHKVVERYMIRFADNICVKTPNNLYLLLAPNSYKLVKVDEECIDDIQIVTFSQLNNSQLSKMNLINASIDDDTEYMIENYYHDISMHSRHIQTVGENISQIQFNSFDDVDYSAYNVKELYIHVKLGL